MSEILSILSQSELALFAGVSLIVLAGVSLRFLTGSLGGRIAARLERGSRAAGEG